MTRKHLRTICISLAAALSLTSCIKEEFHECPNEYELRLVFERNMLNADAFANQVKSVDVKVSDPATGQLVYTHSEQGSALASGGYRVPLPIAPGTYNILCWGSMAEGESFGYAHPQAEMLDQQNVILHTENGISQSRLNNLFHGMMTNVTFIDNNTRGSDEKQIKTMGLTKNTNRIQVLLVNLDGTVLDENDFSFKITSANAEMAYDNALSAKRAVEYRPWHVSAIIPEAVDARAATLQPGVSAEFSTGRLSDSQDSRLEVFRHSSGERERIISVPLEQNLLLYKGEFYSYMSNQEYLDRQDNYTITFILDSHNNWNKTAMIYINEWATLPIQYQEW